jgi:hypothetical protein
VSDIVLDTEAQPVVTTVALLTGDEQQPIEEEVARPYLTPLEFLGYRDLHR